GQQLGDGIGVPPGANWQTTATRTIGDAALEQDVIVENQFSLLLGTNTVAVEVHQVSDTSSDVVFGARIKISAPSEPGVVINEVLPGPAGEGFVEFYNPTTNAVNLGGWFLSDDPANLVKHAIPGSLPLLPGELVTVGFAESQLGLNDSTVVYLTQPDGLTVVNAISTLLVQDGRSLGRKPLGSASWFLFADPTPGQLNQSLLELSSQLRINEVAFNAQGQIVWVELLNTSLGSAPMEPLFLSARRDFSDALDLFGSVGGGGYVSFDTGIDSEDGMLYLIDTGGNVLDAARVEPRAGRLYSQAFPAGSGEWYASTNHTRNAVNLPQRQADIVINEVMFDLPSGQSYGEFIELYNRGTETVDLSGWAFTDGISYDVPLGTSLASGAYLVLASDAAWMQSTYGLQVAGTFSGELANKGEILRLVDEAGNLVDEVNYRVGGNWPDATDGDGSSMELAHPDMDNAVASAWRNSDESGKAGWQSISYFDRYEELLTAGSATDYKELHLHLVGDAHVVLRNIELRKDGTGPNLVANGTQMTTTGSSATGWLAQGTHHASYTDNGELHLISDGHGDNRANRAEIDMPSLVDNDDCTLTFDARWVSGKPRLIVQTWDHSFGFPFLLAVPDDLGTPGAPNSSLLADAAPEVQALRHDPAVPDSTQPVRVTARVSSADALSVVEVVHRPDNINGDAAWVATTMVDDGVSGGDEVAGDGVYTATLNQYQTNNRIVQFYVRAVANGLETFQPKQGAARPAMWVVDNDAINTDLRTSRYIISAYDLDAIGNAGQGAKYNYKFPRLSNHYFNMTHVSNEREIYYGCEIRKSGSPWTRDGGNGLSRAKWKTPTDQPFRNRFKFSIDNDAVGGNRHKNRIIRHWMYLLGHPQNEAEFLRVIINSGNPELREEVEPVATDFIKRNFEDGTRGELYRIDDQWWFTDAWGRTPADANWVYKNTDEAVRYHTEWIKRSREADYDYSSLLNFIKTIDANAFTQEQMDRLMDVQLVMANAAVRGYVGDWDTFTVRRGKNGYFYRKPDGRFMLLHWDSDLAFSNPGDDFFRNSGGVQNYFSPTYNRRWFIYYLSEMIHHLTENSPRIEGWFQAEEDASSDYTMDAPFYRNWFANRKANATSQLLGSENAVFAMISGNGVSLDTTDAVVDLEGASPSRIHTIRAVGHPEATFTWTTLIRWTLSGVEVRNGANVLTIEGLDHNGDVLDSLVFTVNKSGNAPPIPRLAADPGSWNVALDQIFDLDASGSVDPEGSPLSFAWSVTPTNGVTLSADGSQAEAMFSRPGWYTFTVAVTDDQAQAISLSQEASVYLHNDHHGFGSAGVAAPLERVNVAVRDNYAPSTWLSQEEVPGTLLVQVLDDVSKPIHPTAATHPIIWRDLPGGADWSLQTELYLDTNPLGNFMSGLILDMDVSGLPRRYVFGLEDGLILSAKVSSGSSFISVGSETATYNEATIRIRRAGDALRFERRDQGQWLLIATTNLPAGTTAVKGGIFASTDAAQSVRTGFDYLMLVDSSASLLVRDSLRISEIMYHPANPLAPEYIELMNIGSVTIGLEGVQFEDGNPFAAYVFGSYLLDPGARVLLVSDLTAFESLYGTGLPVAGVWADGRLSDGGERVHLLDADGNTIQDFTYGDAKGWPEEPDGAGVALQIIDPAGDASDPTNWRSGGELGGTPGSQGSGIARRIVINEVLTHPAGNAVDAIELYNTTTNVLDLSGWGLSDSPVNLLKYLLPTNSLLPAGGYLVIDESQFNPTPTTPTTNHFGLNAHHGDEVWLTETDGNGVELRLEDDVSFAAAVSGESFGRWPNGLGELVPMRSVSLAAANTGPRVGPLVISEFMYQDPLDVAELEYIEIGNLSSEDVDLGGWRLRGGVDVDFPTGHVVRAFDALLVLPFDPSDTNAMAAFVLAYGLDTNTVSYTGTFASDRLSNEGDELRLMRPQASPVDEPGFTPYSVEDTVVYGVEAPWPVSPAGGGLSLHRLGRDLFGSFALSWQAATPSPGSGPFLPAHVDAWLYTHFPLESGAISLSDDVDSDDHVHLLEYALGLSPLIPDDHPLEGEILQQPLRLRVQYPRDTLVGGLRYRLEVCDTLSAPLWSTNGVSDVLIDTQAGVEVHEGLVPANAYEHRFLRLAIEKLDP
ncbi:MAG: hypothetical protein ACI97B_001815, partial [Verrucomicrobiales bacterium]